MSLRSLMTCVERHVVRLRSFSAASADTPVRVELERLSADVEREIAALAEAWADYFKVVVVAVDDSPPARRAMGIASRFAAAAGSRLVVVHVVPFDMVVTADPVYIATGGADRQRSIEQGRRLVEAACRAAPADAGVDAVVREGDVAREIVAVATERGADLIVIGTRERGRVARTLLGSTAESVLRTAPCPVMVVCHEHDAQATAAGDGGLSLVGEDPGASPAARN